MNKNLATYVTYWSIAYSAFRRNYDMIHFLVILAGIYAESASILKSVKQ